MKNTNVPGWNGKYILDACCGSRMFWFNKKNTNAIFVDNRNFKDQAIWKSTKKDATRYCCVQPDIVADFRHLPFPDNTFWHIVFDPPHLIKIGDSAWMSKKYGKLPADWEKYLRDGFAECWRVLRPYGTLIFKWNEYDIPVQKVISAIGHETLYGHRSGKQSKTHWMAFVKIENEATK